MTHGLLAALFCTTSLILWVIEIFRHRHKKASTGFCILYGLGMMFWAALAIEMNQSWLILISTIQGGCCALLITLQKKKVSHEVR